MSGGTVSCGCRGYEAKCVSKNKTHGMTNSPTWRSWRGMHARCFNANDDHYPDYGARGITVCERWQGEHGFENFLADMGERPEGTTIDRKDNDGNYEPSNCRWATQKEQQRNRRSTRFEPHEPAQVRWLASEGYTHASIAAFFGVSDGSVDDVVKGATWS